MRERLQKAEARGESKFSILLHLSFWSCLNLFYPTAGSGHSTFPLLLDPSAFSNFDRLDENEHFICNVSEFGAVGDGQALDTKAIQSAVDACSIKGKSVLYFPPGIYLTGTVSLKSNMTVYIDRKATILGSSKQQDYPLERSRWYVLGAEDAEYVGITGGGVVDGQGLEFVIKFNERKNIMVSWNTTNACFGDECRPRLVGFVNCEHIHVWNVHLRQPAYWSLHIANSDFIYIHDITIFGDFNTPNNDGIDIDGSNNTYITRCRVDTADDGIVPKSIAGPLFNLTVTNCWIRSKSCAVKIGSETYHDLVGLYFDNITIVDSHRGLGIQLRDSGNIFNVTFSNIILSTRYYDPLWWGRAEPVYVTACPRNLSTIVGSINKVKFVNISATSENGIFLAGSGGGILKGLHFSNFHVRLEKSTSYPGGFHDYRPGCQGLVSHRTAGIFMQHVPDSTLQNVQLSWRMNGMEDWDLPLDFTPQTVGSIKLVNFSSNVYNL